MNTKKQAETPTMRARELRLMANRMRRSGEEELAQQLDKRAAVLLLSGEDADRQKQAARDWLAVFNEATAAHGRLWHPGAEVEPHEGWIGVRGDGPYTGLYPAWVRERLTTRGRAVSVIQEWKRGGWIVADAEGKPTPLTRGPDGRQRMIRMRKEALREVQAIADGSPS